MLHDRLYICGYWIPPWRCIPGAHQSSCHPLALCHRSDGRHFPAACQITVQPWREDITYFSFGRPPVQKESCYRCGRHAAPSAISAFSLHTHYCAYKQARTMVPQSSTSVYQHAAWVVRAPPQHLAIAQTLGVYAGTSPSSSHSSNA